MELLFPILENVTDIKDSRIPCLKQTVSQALSQSDDRIKEALFLCDTILDSEKKFQEEDPLLANRLFRNEEFQRYTRDLDEAFVDLCKKIKPKVNELENIYKT